MAARRKTTTKKPDKEKENGLIASNALGRIEINPKVMLGKPVIRGTRIPVELILRKSGEGATEADLISAYPRLSHEDILAAFSYGAATVAHEEPLTN
jgi:uncharacterized protein (DUF433 family)